MSLQSNSYCPYCGAPLNSARAHGFFEKRVLGMLGLKPFRCKACRRRIVRRKNSVDGERLRPRADVRAATPFVSSDDTDEFDRLIREIASAEREAELGDRRA